MVNCLVFQSDFGLKDGAVSAMYGVAYSVNPDLNISNLTHDIPQYNIWEASYRLIQIMTYWPKGTVFVSVVDPGVGSNRKSAVAKTMTGHYIVTPDNGTLTHIKKMVGVEEIREIDEKVNRLPNSGVSYTFHGRDIYAYTGARLASGIISFEEVGSLFDVESIVELPIVSSYKEKETVHGTIDVLDVRFGSLWTNINRSLFEELGVTFGGKVEITIKNDTRPVFLNTMIYGKSFADVHIGEQIVYVNSLDNMAVAINQGSFARAYDIGTGTNWKISICKA